MEPTSFSKLMARTQTAPGSAVLDVPSDWMQGRSVFGGLQAIIALRAMRTLVPDAVLRSMQATFIAPVPRGPVRAEARILRAGKNATQVEARIVEGDAPLAVAIGLFGRARASAASVEPKPFAAPPGAGDPFRFVPDETPSFTQHFDATWLEGAYPFTQSSATRLVMGLGMHDEGVATEDHVIAMADFVPPIALSHLSAPAPGSTATWMLDFIGRGDFPLTGWHVEAELTAARDGYTSQSLTLWAPSGAAIALGRQAMLVFG